MPTKRKPNRMILLPLKWAIVISSMYSVQAADIVESKKAGKTFAEQGIIEISGSASGSYRLDGRGGSATLSPAINYFVFHNWFLGAGLSLQYSNFDPDPKNVNPNSKIQWYLSYLPTIEIGYARVFSLGWYWSVSVGQGYYDAITYQDNGPYFYNLLYANAAVKHAIGDSALLIVGARIDTQTIGNLFVGFSVYF